MERITEEDEKIQELHLKRLFEKSKKLVSIKPKLSDPTEEQEQWIKRMLPRFKSDKRRVRNE